MALDGAMPILVVDDYRAVLRIIGNLLKQIGFADVDEATEGGAALAMMQEKRYGLVIADWYMEPMSGLELLRTVRADPALGKTPIIIITGDSRPENVIIAKKAGVNGFIVKPFNAATLQSKIEMIFAPRRTAPPPSAADPRRVASKA